MHEDFTFARRLTANRHLRTAAIFVLAISAMAASAGAVTLPPGFTDEMVVAVGSPTALAFTPDGRILITSQPGQLRVYQNGGLVGTAALDLTGSICTNSEHGLLGVAVDPSFATPNNNFIYLYYTFNRAGNCVNRVSRFVLSSSNVASGETVLIDNIPSGVGPHNAGDVQFGKDGYLYVSVGDGYCDFAGRCGAANTTSRDESILLGKILRITRDGNIPPDNPFLGTGTADCRFTGGTTVGNKCRETFAWGLRNPFRMGFDPNAAGTRFFINDVGENTWEEIDLGQAGADYGWNVREGHCATGSTTDCGPPPVGMTNPIYDYGHDTGCSAITGAAFVPQGVWPAAYDGDYLFMDYVCGKIFRLEPSGPGYVRTEFVTGLGGGVVDLAFGPRAGSQALYYTNYANGGEVHRIYFSAGNGVPTALMTANPTSGIAPLTVNFDGSGSSDPDGDALTWLWSFGDGQSTSTTTPLTQHVYSSTGTFTASLTVRDARGATSAPVTASISVGNTAPVPTIQSPSAGSTFTVGQTITLTGSATDAQDGTINPATLQWTVLRHHMTHTHPYFSGTGNNLTFTAPAPEDLVATTSSYLEIYLTATDSGGLSATANRNIQPRTVAVTLATSPSGLNLTVNGTTVTGPTTITSWVGWRLDLTAPSPQGRYRFSTWSDGGAQAHSVTTPAAPATYTAKYKKGPPR
jgi:glucose/arabinose dehydrogenase